MRLPNHLLVHDATKPCRSGYSVSATSQDFEGLDPVNDSRVQSERKQRGGDDMTERVRAHDWASTPPGPRDRWPAELGCIVDLVLASPIVASVVVGPERVLIYNDAAALLYGDKHPAALGRPVAESWPDIWPEMAHLYERVFAGESVHVSAQPLDVERPGAGQVFDAYLLPVRAVDGTVIAAHMNGFEIGAKLRLDTATRENETRQAFLLDLSDRLRTKSDAHSTVMTSLELLAEYLQLDRTYVAQVDKAQDRAEIGPEFRRPELAPIAGVLTLSDFPDAFDRVEANTLVLKNTASDPSLSELDRQSFAALGMGALIVASARKGTRNPVWALLVATTEPRQWTFADVALVEDVAERTWAAVERIRAETALRQSETRYRTLFETMGQGFAEGELIRDDVGRVIDYRMIDLNTAFERLTGLSRAAAQGRPVREVVPSFEDEWVETATRAVEHGTPQRIERDVAGLDRVIEATYYPAMGDRFSVIYDDVTERKRAEQTLQDSEERQAFLLQLSDAFRAEESAEAIGSIATGMVGRHLRADRSYICRYAQEEGLGWIGPEYRLAGLPPLTGEYQIADFPDGMKRLETGPLVIRDLLTDASMSEADKRSIGGGLGLHAMIAAALRRGENKAMWCLVAATAKPRD